MTDSKSRCVVEISTDTRPIVFLTIDRLSTDCRPTIDRYIDRLSTNCRPSIDGLSTDYGPIVDRVSTDCRPSIDRLSTAMSTAISTDTSVDITHSKQDPIILSNNFFTTSLSQGSTFSLPLFQQSNIILVAHRY